ncbi:D-2-hydroxyacid dehydrogenase [Portibacter lacus]|uniref:3-phosphoglycerate dehydrogenase n=1 Tax=Portibacter lacus TaxID=1099794 RepID=A0AA37SX08_9BACT|nr:D-2-hydroxyacid dehydrogenase [Portibacter lacus]GLR19220.1 3-phosphoglycerate dehydrogenase [Portibacter lacus]
MKILINDGIHPTGKKLLENAGYEVSTDKIAQEDLPGKLNDFDAICVRSATKVRADLIDQSPNLKAICRGGVGLDNIDVDHAKSKGIHVINTPAASSRSVAELVFGHLYSLARFLHISNREMPSQGNTNFKVLKKNYAAGIELTGRTLGIIGFGRIGQETASIALGAGMDVIAVDPFLESADISFGPASHKATVTIKTSSMEDMLANADAISLHVPFLGEPALGEKEFAQMKDGVIIVNASRGGTVDEDALLAAIASGKVASAGLDVFIGEPTPREDLLTNSKISLTPHIGAATAEAQEKIGIELAEKLIAALS